MLRFAAATRDVYRRASLLRLDRVGRLVLMAAGGAQTVQATPHPPARL
jgi:hypothetical protein